MKKQKKLTSIAASIAMMAVSALSVGGATFAWFTRGTEAQATGFDFTAAAASGIQISTDATNWQSSITAADFAGVTAQAASRVSVQDMEPVSTINSVASGVLNFYGATYTGDNYVLSANTEDYLVFDLYFLNQGADALTLRLAPQSQVTDGDVDKDTSLATRVAFIVEGNSTVPATAIAANSGSSAYIWEPNSLVRSSVAQGRPGTVLNAKYAYNGLFGTNGGNEISSAAVDGFVDDYGYFTENAGYASQVTNTNDLAIGDPDVFATLPGNSNITKVKVFVWIEGQDIDCNNGTSAGDVNIDFYFDSGAQTGTSQAVVANRTATSATTTAVTLDGVYQPGAAYSAFVIFNGTDTNAGASGLSYRRLAATGTSTGIDAETAITLGSAAAAGTYEIVVVGRYLGYVSARTVAASIAIA